MSKRILVQRRRLIRKAFTATALGAALALEGLLLGGLSMEVFRPTVESRLTIDPGRCFRGW